MHLLSHPFPNKFSSIWISIALFTIFYRINKEQKKFSLNSGRCHFIHFSLLVLGICAFIFDTELLLKKRSKSFHIKLKVWVSLAKKSNWINMRITFFIIKGKPAKEQHTNQCCVLWYGRVKLLVFTLHESYCLSHLFQKLEVTSTSLMHEVKTAPTQTRASEQWHHERFPAIFWI